MQRIYNLFNQRPAHPSVHHGKYTRWIKLSGVRKLFGFLGCSRSSKFGFGLNWDVRKCSKFDLNVRRTLQTFGEQYFFSILLFEHTLFVNVQSQKNFTFSNKQFFCLKKIETQNLVKNVRSSVCQCSKCLILVFDPPLDPHTEFLYVCTILY